MEHSEVAAVLIQLGYSVENGYVVSGRYRYGRLGEDAFHPEGTAPVPWKEIGSFGDCDQGSFGHFLEIIEPAGTRVRLPRTELSGTQNRIGLKINPNGNGYLMPSSISDLVNAWPSVFPDFRQKCWKEITTGYIMVDLSLIGEEGLKSLDDPMTTRIAAYVQESLKRLGCTGKQPPKDIIRDVLISEADRNPRNAFLDMMRSRRWDGCPRMDRVFIDVFGACMHQLPEKESDTVLKDVCRCWFLGAVARQHKAVQLDIIPIMIGATGTRKSSAVRWIATCNEFYRDPLDISEKRFVEDTKGGLIVELAEMKATKGMDNDYLKGFISRSSDHIRLPYDRCASENIRRFVIIGTTNESEFLSDPTGNRRYFPFEADPDRTKVRFGEKGFRSPDAAEYILQVWAEAYHRYMSGEKWDLGTETLRMATGAQESSTVNDPNLDLLSELVDEFFPLPGDRICLKDLVYILGSKGATYGIEAAEAARTWWRAPHHDWSRSSTQRINADERRGWLGKPTVVMKCRTRTLPSGCKAPQAQRVLGE